MHDAHPPILAVREAVARALAEDLTPIGDLTSALLPPDLEATARSCPGRRGAGRAALRRRGDPPGRRRAGTWSADDGDRVAAGVAVGRGHGPLAPILTAERTALNFLCHLSGVATLTARFVDAVAEVGGDLRVWDTRKTTPGLRTLEKAAVRAGGARQPPGQPVRLGDVQGQPPRAARHRRGRGRARRRWPGARSTSSAATSTRCARPSRPGPTPCCSTTWRPTRWRASVADGPRPSTRPPAARDLGHGHLETVRRYATTGADLVSIGALTTRPPSSTSASTSTPADTPPSGPAGRRSAWRLGGLASGACA